MPALNLSNNIINSTSKNLTLPGQELVNQARLILKGPGFDLIKTKFFVVDTKKLADEGTVFEPGVGTDNYDKKSLFGTPIFDVVTLDAVSYQDENGKTVNLSKLSLSIALITVDKPRNIVKTRISGRNGTVKEYMSDDDYQITISGLLTNPLAFSSPAQLVRDFDAFTKVPQQLKVESNFLSYLGITDIVITNSKTNQVSGTRNAVEYELMCISDTPFAIELQEQNKYTRTSPSF